jgi:hypothetical protein
MTDLPEGEKSGAFCPSLLCDLLRTILLLGFFSTEFVRHIFTPLLKTFSRIATSPGTILSLFEGSFNKEVSVIGFWDCAKTMFADQFPTRLTMLRSNPVCAVGVECHFSERCAFLEI